MRIFNHRSTHQSYLSTLFVLRLSAWTFLGLAARQLLLIYVYLPSGAAVLYPNAFLSFYRVYYRHIGYLILLASQPFPIWTILRGPLLGFLKSLLSKQAACILPPKFIGGTFSCCWMDHLEELCQALLVSCQLSN